MSSPASPQASDEVPLPTVTYVREQYRWKERKLVTVTSSAPTASYVLATKDAAIVVITTDSVIQYDVIDISNDSPQLAGTTTTYDRFTLPLERIPQPKILYFKWVLGTGNIWLVIGN